RSYAGRDYLYLMGALMEHASHRSACLQILLIRLCFWYARCQGGPGIYCIGERFTMAIRILATTAKGNGSWR
ncbi:MAG: hypothetical protein KGJ73_03715, partial [Rhodospirillales bacterium]|nr:hypothetical protein [Rhodospirillales bacterium]